MGEISIKSFRKGWCSDDESLVDKCFSQLVNYGLSFHKKFGFLTLIPVIDNKTQDKQYIAPAHCFSLLKHWTKSFL